MQKIEKIQPSQSGRLNRDVSVVIPWGKVQGDLGRCIDSALKQELQPTEVIVVANGKVSEKLANEWRAKFSDSSVSIVYVPGCTNANIARNIGAAQAKCTYVAFLDSDDWWERSHLEVSLATLESSNAMLVYSGMVVHRKGGVTEEHCAEDFLNHGNMETYLLKYLPAQSSSFVVRRSSLMNCLWNVQLNRHQDYEFLARCADRYKVRSTSATTTNIDWTKKVRHKHHGDCLKLLYEWKTRVPLKLYRRHFKNLVMSSIRCNDFAWILRVHQYF
jgi:glycosyltransferase involved in cell wall biosynthesis